MQFSWAHVYFGVCAVLAALWVARRALRATTRRVGVGTPGVSGSPYGHGHGQKGSAEEAQWTKNEYVDIEPRVNFRWETTSKVKFRPFKGAYHLTMALQSSTISDLFEMDETYLDMIRERRRLLDAHREDVVGFNPVAKEAVNELYEWVFGVYLPRRYPAMFVLEDSKLRQKHAEAQRLVRNLVTDDLVPLQPPEDPVEALKMLGGHVDCDLLLLVPNADPNGMPARAEPTATPQTPYHLQAFVCTFPSGFNTREKLGLPLAGIHRPVPGYGDKLQKSMDRYFASLPFGKMVKRVNWACQQDGQLFKLEGNHLSIADPNNAHGNMPEPTKEPQVMTPCDITPSEQDYRNWEEAAEAVEPTKCMLRTERQTLHRLEKTGALLFCFKTYLYALSEIKEEGLGPEMADAIEGLEKGNVPGMRVYKRSVVWGSKVKAYLREKNEKVMN